jgi:hypothetical protein
MGRWLRERYSDGMQFLPAAYHPGLLSCHTTKYSRTRATLRGVLTGERDRWDGEGGRRMGRVESGGERAGCIAVDQTRPHSNAPHVTQPHPL